MAAATVASRDDSVIGSRRMIAATLSAVADTNTWATGLKKIFSVVALPAVVAGTGSVGATVSGGTVTFAVSGSPGVTQVLVEGI